MAKTIQADKLATKTILDEMLRLVVSKLLAVVVSKYKFLGIVPFPWILTGVFTKVISSAINYTYLGVALSKMEKVVKADIDSLRDVLDEADGFLLTAEEIEKIDEKLFIQYRNLFKF